MVNRKAYRKPPPPPAPPPPRLYTGAGVRIKNPPGFMEREQLGVKSERPTTTEYHRTGCGKSNTMSPMSVFSFFAFMFCFFCLGVAVGGSLA
jgi:hypothetical protein